MKCGRRSVYGEQTGLSIIDSIPHCPSGRRICQNKQNQEMWLHCLIEQNWSNYCGRRGVYMCLGISLFEGNMVASGFESYLVSLCFILWEGACTGSYRTRSYDK